MKKRLKKISTLGMALGLCICMPLSASAKENTVGEETYEIVYNLDGEFDQSNLLRYTLIYKLGIGLTIQNKIAYVYTECKTYNSANITLKAELQRYSGSSWSTIKTFTNSDTNATICSIDNSYAVTQNYEYRVKLTATVTVGSQTETDTKYGNEISCYSLILEEE